jgi:hypothetical protein
MNYDELIQKYVKSFSKGKDFEVKADKYDWFTEIVFVIDTEKIDKNSKRYDPTYSKKFFDEKNLNRRMVAGIRISLRNWAITHFIRDMKKVLSLPKMEIRPKFEYINYDYLNQFETKINKAIKKTSSPNTRIEFYLDGDAPNAKIEITNFTYNNKDEIFNFVEEIQKKNRH